MEEFAKVFGLYDVVSYFVPGAVLAWAILEAYKAHESPIVEVQPSMAAFLLAAYIAGHMIQAAASWIDDECFRTSKEHAVATVYKADEDKAFRDLLSTAIKERFNTDSPKDYFKYCEVYARNHHIDTYTEMFLANRGLFRGLALSMALSFFAFLYALTKDRKNVARICFCVALAVGAGASFLRFAKFNQYWVDSIYRTWYVDYAFPLRDTKR